MSITIKCKKCGEENELSEALKGQIEEQLLREERIKHQEDLERVKKEAETTANQKCKTDYELVTKSLQDEAKEEKDRNKLLSEQLLNITKELRDAKRSVEDIKLEAQKQVAADEEKIRQEASAKAEEEHRLKDLEKDKKLHEALEVNAELKKKLEQGSQQTQGAVMELELEKQLRNEFPNDVIKDVVTGKRGADITQIVMTKFGEKCGTILWESKNANWQNGWISKLKDDQRNAITDVAVLVCNNLPEDIKNFTFKEGVWVSNRESVLGLAWALRMQLGKIFQTRQAAEGKDEKMEVLYSYLTGSEFIHRVEAIIEAFSNLQGDIEKEKRWFQTKWANQEKEIRKVIDNTQGLYGDLQGITNRSLPEIKSLQIEAGFDQQK